MKLLSGKSNLLNDRCYILYFIFPEGAFCKFNEVYNIFHIWLQRDEKFE